MFKSIDVKSALIGGLVVALVICSVGAVGYVAGDSYDRFKLIPTTGYIFLLDRQTGQVWAVQNPPEGVIAATPHPEEEFYAPKVIDEFEPVSQ